MYTYPHHVAVQAEQIEKLIGVGGSIVESVNHHHCALWCLHTKIQEREKERRANKYEFT